MSVQSTPFSSCPQVEIDDIQAGKAGVHIVCADLILAGYVAFPSEEALSFDVVVEVQRRLFKVQVKTTRKAVPLGVRNHMAGYVFNINKRGKNGKRTYVEGDLDIFAYVALDARDIGYQAARTVGKTATFRSSLYRGQYRDERIIVRNTKIRELHKQGLTYKEISERVNLHYQNVIRVVNGKIFDPLPLRYLRDLSFSKAVEDSGILRSQMS